MKKGVGGSTAKVGSEEHRKKRKEKGKRRRGKGKSNARI